MKEPTIIHYAFARNWPLKGYFGAWGIAGIVMAVSVCEPNREMFKDWVFCVFFIVSLLVAPVLFVFFSLIVGPFVFVPLYYIGHRMAGAPFHVGDRVRVLVGPHRDLVVEIYDVWESRSQVRVKLDEQAKTEVNDVFDFTQVFRESPKTPPAGEYRGRNAKSQGYSKTLRRIPKARAAYAGRRAYDFRCEK